MLGNFNKPKLLINIFLNSVVMFNCHKQPLQDGKLPGFNYFLIFYLAVDSDPTEGFRSLEYKLHHGWSKQAVERNKPNPQGKYLWDKYIYSPTGKYLRSNPQLEKYIEENPNFECDRNETNFIWNEKELLKFQTKWNAQSIHRRTQDSTSSQQ